MLVYYENLQTAYGWTVEEIDRQDTGFLLRQLAAKVKASGEAAQQVSIEDVIF